MQSLIESLLKEDVQDFIFLNENADVQKLLLKQSDVLGVPTEHIAQQLTGRKKAKTKIASWYNMRGIVYPPSLNVEQCSSEATGKFKLTLLKGIINDEDKVVSVADLTGGLGVDTFYLSHRAQHVDYVEPDGELYELAKHNHKVLGTHNHNITHYHASAEDYLETLDETLDLIYIDPSRRKSSQKVYKLAECEPNVVQLQSELLQKTDFVLIKTSPLLDIQQGCRELQNVSLVIVVAVDNECKELLFLLEQKFSGEPVIRAVELNRYGEIISDASFSLDEEKNSKVEFSSPLAYLYEPSAAVLKSGAFKGTAEKFHLKKLAPSSHLYTSDVLVDFPGRVFKVVEHVKLTSKLKDRFKDGHANIITRNHPLSVEEIKKKTGLKEGGEEYLIGTQGEKEKFVMIAERIK
jgi:16S rRNA G966 N2-methylase RsmD